MPITARVQSTPRRPFSKFKPYHGEDISSDARATSSDFTLNTPETLPVYCNVILSYPLFTLSTSFYGSFYANNDEGALNTPETLPVYCEA
eukprot:6890487-Pyramimonas_sp.AAC.1